MRNTATMAINMRLVRRFRSLSASSLRLFLDPGLDLHKSLDIPHCHIDPEGIADYLARSFSLIDTQI